jgi:hypothetical protein
MTKRFCTAFALLAAVALSGCFTLDEIHNRNHLRSIESDWNAIHETIDRHFFNYDWDDPDDY